MEEEDTSKMLKFKVSAPLKMGGWAEFEVKMKDIDEASKKSAEILKSLEETLRRRNYERD